MLRSQDAWYVVLFIDPIGIPITKWLAKTRVTPNQVTIIAILLKAIAVWLIWIDHPWWCFVFWQLGFLLDCVDGPLARLTRQFSPYGELLDHGSDVVLQWAFSLSIIFHVLLPQNWLLAIMTALWTLLWMANWWLVERKEENIVSTGADFTRRNPTLNAYTQWAARHRLKLLPITGIEEVTVIFPLGYALGWLPIVVPILLLFRLLAVFLHVIR
jgi:phosphatidylglycerophosphate synthase